jgi:hypothetical protein
MSLSNKKNSIGVIYLMWEPYGITHFNSFINSYLENAAGVEHQLWIIFNGINDRVPNEYMEILLLHKIDCNILTMKSGQDIDAYRYAAEKIDVEFLLFLNTYSILLTGDWLKKYINAFHSSKTAIVGATASNQSHYSTVFKVHKKNWEKEKSFQDNFKKYKLFIKAFFYWRLLFKSFPSPHLRTNAFMIQRKLFLELVPKSIQNKFEAFQFESGRNSLTVQCFKKGLEVLVVDKNGKTYPPEEWKQSSTYRINNQENLIVSDNQTRLYDESTEEQKIFMTKMAWGNR